MIALVWLHDTGGNWANIESDMKESAAFEGD